MRRIIIILLFFWTTFAMSMTETEQQFFDAVNQYREFMGKKQLKYNEKLHKAAQDQCQYMNDTLDYWHQRKDGSQPWDRVTKFWYKRASIRENIARMYDRWPIYVLFWFVNSSSHNATLLRKTVNDLWVSQIWDYRCLLVWREL